MTQYIFQYFWFAAFAAYVLWSIASGSADSLLAGLAQRWRRKRYRADPNADPVQAMLDEYAAVMAPNAGVAVATVTPAGVQHYFAGHIDGRDSASPDADTPFEIGSITKTFTATLLVAMEHQGLARLETRLDELLPEGGHLGQQLPVPVTLEGLATHCSGLPRLPQGLPLWAGLYCTPKQPCQFITRPVLRRWLRGRRIRFGQRFRYSNLGYGVLGNVLGDRADSSWAEALRHFVLHPIGLECTYVGGAAGRRDTAQPHTSLGRRVPIWHTNALDASGALHSSLNDMTRWLKANLTVTSPLDARLHEARANAGGKHRSMALAWHVDGEGDRRVVWHNGQTGGSSAVMAFAPARGTGIVVLGNSATSVDALGLRILRYINTPADAAASNANSSTQAQAETS